MTMGLFIATLLAAFGAGRMSKGLFQKKRPMPPNGSALQQQPEPVWAQWSQEIGRAIAGRKE